LGLSKSSAGKEHVREAGGHLGAEKKIFPGPMHELLSEFLRGIKIGATTQNMSKECRVSKGDKLNKVKIHLELVLPVNIVGGKISSKRKRWKTVELLIWCHVVIHVLAHINFKI
jgi:hypothetical protein